MSSGPFRLSFARGSISVAVWLVVVAGLFIVAVGAETIPLSAGVAGLILVCFVCELMDSSLGMGYGTTLTPLLLLAGYDPHELVPTILVSEFLSGFASFFFHAEAGNVRIDRNSVHLRSALILSLCSLLGVVVGAQMAFRASTLTLNRIIGVVILGAGLTLLAASTREFAYRTWKIGLLGLVASFNKAVSGGGYGPLMTSGQVLSGIEGKAAVGITSLAEGFTCLAGAITFLALGQRLSPGLLIPVVTGALMSVPFSARIVRGLRERTIKRTIGVLTVLLGLLALAKTFEFV